MTYGEVLGHLMMFEYSKEINLKNIENAQKWFDELDILESKLNKIYQPTDLKYEDSVI